LLSTATSVIKQLVPDQNKLVLVGHSMGGLVCRYAIQFCNAQCSSFVTLNTGHFGFRESGLAKVINKNLLKYTCVSEMLPGSLLLWKLDSSFQYNSSCPFLSIAGSNDDCVLESSASLVECAGDGSPLQRQACCGRFQVILGATHTSTLSNQGVFNLIKAFTDKPSNIPDGQADVGESYFLFTSNNPMKGKYPELNLDGKNLLASDSYSSSDKKAGYFWWVYVLPQGSGGNALITFNKNQKQPLHAVITPFQSSIMKDKIPN
jgi:Predicted acetyltransferases and hydrolases with the alpha/beta hydrolase fold